MKESTNLQIQGSYQLGRHTNCIYTKIIPLLVGTEIAYIQELYHKVGIKFAYQKLFQKKLAWKLQGGAYGGLGCGIVW